MKQRAGILLALIAAFSFSFANAENIIWETEGWASGCKFINRDMSSVQVPANKCGPRCVETSGCTHFTWSSGTCYLKNGDVCRNDAVSTDDPTGVCGIIPSADHACHA